MIKPSLKKEIGALGIAANMVNIIVGSGIYILPAMIAGYLAEASILAYLSCGLLLLLIMLCFAYLGSKSTDSGGAFNFVYNAFGDYFGFLINILFWFGTGVIMNAAIINAMADMLQIEQMSYRYIFFLTLLSLFCIINILGVKYGNSFVIINTIIKLCPLILIIFLGLYYLKTNPFYWQNPPTWERFGSASLLLFFAFGGGESALSVSGEIKNPQKNVPLGILGGLFMVLFLYIGLQITTQSALGTKLWQQPDAPIAKVATLFLGAAGGLLVRGAGIFSIFASLSGSVLSYPRVLFGGAEKGWFPQFLSKIHPKYATPFWAIITYSILVFLFASIGQFKTLANISSASLLLIYLGVAFAAIKQKRAQKGKIEGFDLPFGVLIPSLASLGIIWFLSNLKKSEVLSFIIAISILSLIYFLIFKFKKS